MRKRKRKPLRRRETKKTVACGYRRISGRHFSPPENKLIFGWREATTANTSVSAG